MGRSRYKKGSLATKLTLTMTSLVILTVTGITLMSLYRERQTFQIDLEQKAKVILNSLEAASEDAIYRQDADYLNELLEDLKKEGVIMHGFIYDRRARIIADADEEELYTLNKQPFAEKLLQEEEVSFDWGRTHVLVGKRVEPGGQIIGAIGLRLNNNLNEKRGKMLNQSLIAALIASVLGAVVALVFSRSLTEPLEEMTAATQRLAEGDLTQKITVRTNDELAILANTFNIMTEQLRTYMNRLEQRAEELRRSEKLLLKKAQREQLLKNLTQQIRQSLDLDNILATAVQGIFSLLGVDSCKFLWYEDNPQPAWDCVHEAKHPEVPSKLGKHPVDPANELHQKIFKLEMIRIDNLNPSPKTVHPNLNIFQDFTSVLALPIITPKGDIGLVCCGQFHQSHHWQNSEVQLLQTVCDQLVIAISQAALYRQANQRATELELALAELKRTQSQLVQNEKMASLGQLVAGVAHEINNPVGFIQGNVNFAKSYAKDILYLLKLYQKHYPEPKSAIQQVATEIDLEYLLEDFPKLLKSMEVGAERISEIVVSLRNFSRLDEAEKKPVDIHDGIEGALMILTNRLKGKPHRPDIKVIKAYSSLPKVTCYPGQLNQVFLNIIANSIDALEEVWEPENQVHSDIYFTHKQQIPQICITTEQIAAHTVAVKIKDNGLGIPEAIQDRLFDPFFTTKPVGKGTGLGLSISHQIVVERHGGKLTCASIPGQGTEFSVEIPL